MKYMKNKILFLLVLFITALSFSSCEKHSDGNREEVLVNINGNWDIYYNNTIDGEIMFDEYDMFMLSSNKGPVLFGNMTMLPNQSNVLSIYYVEDENGEEYDYGGYCTITPFSMDSIIVNNLPYYENKDVTLVRK